MVASLARSGILAYCDGAGNDGDAAVHGGAVIRFSPSLGLFAPMSSCWFVYILCCADGTFYTGIATDVERRLREHNAGGRTGARYTRSRRPVVLWHTEQVEDRAAAARREAAIKKMTRAQKQALASRE